MLAPLLIIIITASVLTFGIILEVNSYVLLIMLILPNIVIMFIVHYRDVLRKPLVSVRVKVIKTWVDKNYFFNCLLPDGNIKHLVLSKKQWRALKKNEHVDVIYQGYIAHSIRKYPNGVIIFHDEFSQIKIERNSDKILTYKQAMKSK